MKDLHDWTNPDEKGIIHVPDELDELTNMIATQLRFHTISGKSEGMTIAHIAFNAQKFFAALQHQSGAGDFQEKVGKWLHDCFGDQIASDPIERGFRFLEESLELIQSVGVTKQQASQLLDYTFSRPVGEPKQEVGGVMVTLAALCHACGISQVQSAESEYQRIILKIDSIRAKHQSKPKDILSPIPGNLEHPHPTQQPVSESGEGLVERMARALADIMFKCNDTRIFSIASQAFTQYQQAQSIPGVKGEGWRPIDEAPKDGTLVDLWVTRFADHPVRYTDMGFRKGEWRDAGGFPLFENIPTHWQPIPQPPETSNS